MTGAEWFCLSDGCSRTSNFFRLTMSPNLLDTFANQSKSCCAESWVCATNAQSSANNKYLITEEKILVWACNRRKLKILPSVRNWIRTPMSQSLKATRSIIEKKILKSSGARTQPCLVPWVTLNDADVLPLSQRSMPSWKERMMLMHFGGQPIFFKSRGLPDELNRRRWWDLWRPYRDPCVVLGTSPEAV